MAWNPKHHFTNEGFRQHVKTVASESMQGLRTRKIDRHILLPLWWTGQEVRVFSEPSIPDNVSRDIAEAVNERFVQTIGLQCEFKFFGAHQSAMQQIAAAMVNSQIDHERLFDLALSESWRNPEYGGRQHADIYITTKPFLNDRVSWAAADFNYGAMVFCLHSNRYLSSEFLRKVALHEANHLLGMPCHCDDHQNVDGFEYSTACNMHYVCPKEELCPKCAEFIRAWWDQVIPEYERFSRMHRSQEHTFG
jgi:predicted Zn-dependent protease